MNEKRKESTFFFHSVWLEKRVHTIYLELKSYKTKLCILCVIDAALSLLPSSLSIPSNQIWY